MAQTPCTVGRMHKCCLGSSMHTPLFCSHACRATTPGRACPGMPVRQRMGGCPVGRRLATFLLLHASGTLGRLLVGWGSGLAVVTCAGLSDTRRASFAVTLRSGSRRGCRRISLAVLRDPRPRRHCLPPWRGFGKRHSLYCRQSPVWPIRHRLRARLWSAVTEAWLMPACGAERATMS
jgi:hypothetical protein